MRKISKIILIAVIVLLVILIAILAVFFPSPKQASSNTVTLQNPVLSLPDSQAVELFDESFIKYLLYSINADELHNPPLSDDTPKIEIQVSGEIYSAEIKENSISITTKQEAVKMLRDSKYIPESFNLGLSSTTIVAGKPTLLAKGYLKIYNQLSGDS